MDQPTEFNPFAPPETVALPPAFNDATDRAMFVGQKGHKHFAFRLTSSPAWYAYFVSGEHVLAGHLPGFQLGFMPSLFQGKKSANQRNAIATSYGIGLVVALMVCFWVRLKWTMSGLVILGSSIVTIIAIAYGHWRLDRCRELAKKYESFGFDPTAFLASSKRNYVIERERIERIHTTSWIWNWPLRHLVFELRRGDSVVIAMSRKAELKKALAILRHHGYPVS